MLKFNLLPTVTLSTGLLRPLFPIYRRKGEQRRCRVRFSPVVHARLFSWRRCGVDREEAFKVSDAEPGGRTTAPPPHGYGDFCRERPRLPGDKYTCSRLFFRSAARLKWRYQTAQRNNVAVRWRRAESLNQEFAIRELLFPPYCSTLRNAVKNRDWRADGGRLFLLIGHDGITVGTMARQWRGKKEFVHGGGSQTSSSEGGCIRRSDCRLS